eukprot:TRINITY_DN3877_c0_g1_i2.p2 TRINITY_DN3877_c0_g1~~TRINITY_DN3877_c0_g1_i2.p2  ORF type:complete len:124 (+),score=25.89 TRINITY_DN3877_c0_g1_i2:349-720(+)
MGSVLPAVQVRRGLEALRRRLPVCALQALGLTVVHRFKPGFVKSCPEMIACGMCCNHCKTEWSSYSMGGGSKLDWLTCKIPCSVGRCLCCEGDCGFSKLCMCEFWCAQAKCLWNSGGEKAPCG